MNKIIPISFLFFLCMSIAAGQGLKEKTETYIRNSQSSDPVILMKTIHMLETEIETVSADFSRRWEAGKRDIDDAYAVDLGKIDKLEPEIWETDEDFRRRQEQERRLLQQQRFQALQDLQDYLDTEESRYLLMYQKWKETALENLGTQRGINSREISVEPQEYFRNERRWPIHLSSSHPIASFDQLKMTIRFGLSRDRSEQTEEDLKQEIIDFNQAVQTGSLSADIDWKVVKDEKRDTFVIAISKVSLHNPVGGRSYVQEFPELVFAQAYKTEGLSLDETVLLETSVISDIVFRDPVSLEGAGTMQVQPGKTAEIPDVQIIPENTLDKTLTWYAEDTEVAEISHGKRIEAKEIGKTYLSIAARDGFTKEAMLRLIVKNDIGDEGPAGGLIFYENPEYRKDGWRFLEAAPPETEWSGKVWGGYNTLIGETETAVGSGKKNTEVIVSLFGEAEPDEGVADYAARLCYDLEVVHEGRTYDDWFLPSKNELNLMYENLNENGLGGFSSWGDYWSSSELSGTEAWYKDFNSPSSLLYPGKYQNCNVRAVRAF